ncbi:MAG: 50S ribosomal protein L11 methyltransferase [Myxococcota bacterium]|nr:50S ribosomal protein L11 methyltransferase [Myxococcota bacterium]
MGKDLCVALYSPEADLADRVVAEVYASGAAGVLEESDGDRIKLTIYLDSEVKPAVWACLQTFVSEGLAIDEFQTIAPVSWSESWKKGHGPIEISPRLLVRPPFAPTRTRAGQAEVVIDPGQAFGTGQHESTQLALECIDERLMPPDSPPRTLLDVGTGSGVLALAALRLGAGWALGHDLDKVAVLEAARHAGANRLESRLSLFAGPIQALERSAFDLVVVNMLRSEMIPIASEISARVGSHLILSGLLDADVEVTLARFLEEGLGLLASRDAVDDSGNVWVGLILTPQ